MPSDKNFAVHLEGFSPDAVCFVSLCRGKPGSRGSRKMAGDARGLGLSEQGICRAQNQVQKVEINLGCMLILYICSPS